MISLCFMMLGTSLEKNAKTGYLQEWLGVEFPGDSFKNTSQWMAKLSSAFSLHVIGLARSMVAPEITQFSMVGEPKNLANFKIYCTSLTLKFIPLNIAYVKYFFVL